MRKSTNQIEMLVRAMNLLFVILLVYIIAIFYFYYNPKPIRTTIEESPPSIWKLKSLLTDIPSGEKGEKIKFGYKLITNTTHYVGPLAKDSKNRFAGNNLSCNNCHLDAGRKMGSGSFVGITNRFPQFRGRENKIGTLKERIDGCFERSMNGKKMPPESKEMNAMIAYMEWLSDGVPEEIEKVYKGYVKIEISNVKADVTAGKELYEMKCMRCHLDNGAGIVIAGNVFSGYINPPLGGNDTFNDGAGMNRVLTAAQFIKGNMPFGATYDSPQVTDIEAYNIAAYINTFPRPIKENKYLDFPDKKLKPVSTPYGPWVDDFSPEQHKFGPFPPIISFYKAKYDIVKKK